MGKIIEFPSGDPKKREKNLEEPKSKKRSPEEIRAKAEGYFLGEEKKGNKFLINWRKYFELFDYVKGISFSQSAQNRNLALYQAELGRTSDKQIMDLVNNSARNEWNEKPIYWKAVLLAVIDRKLYTKKIKK